MLEFYGASRNLFQKYNKLVYEENYKKEQKTNSSILNKKFGGSLVN